MMKLGYSVQDSLDRTTTTPATSTLQATPTRDSLPRRMSDFATLGEALDYAARGATGINFYSGKGVLTEALSYRVLREQSLVLARKLVSCGLEPGDRVALIAETEGDFARAFFACEYAGLVPTALPLPAAFGGNWDQYVRSFYTAQPMGIAEKAAPGTVILAMLPDTAERYLTTPLFDTIAEDMDEEEVQIARSTPGFQLG